MSAIQKLLTEHIDIWTAAETEKKSGRGRSSGNAGNVYGIKKLRELILELAVRGKLVPQDANDEPASALVERINKENTKLLEMGLVKKEKPLDSIDEQETSYDLPSGWTWGRVGETGQYINGLAFKPSDWGRKGRPIIRIQNLSGRNQEFNRTERQVDDSVLVRPGDILVSWSATLDTFYWTATEEGVLNQHIFRVIPNGLVSKSYLYWLLKAAIREMEAGDDAHGLVMTHINRGPFLAHIIAIPPLAEQHRIVAKVDELMALCDQLENQHSNAAEAHEKLVSHLLGTLTQSPVRGELVEPRPSTSSGRTEFEDNWQRIAEHFDTLFTTEASIDALKQTLLQLAVMGKLVPQDLNDEPASELLKRIQAEKAKLVIEGKIKKGKPLAAITEEEKPFVLPPRWEWVRFQDITKLITDGKHGDCNNSLNSGYFFLSAKDIQNGKLLYENARQIEPTEFQEVHQRTGLESGDICMVNTGATVGKIALAPDHPFTSKTTFQKSVAIIKLIRPHIDQRYITNFLIAEAPNLLKKSGGSAINNLLLGDLKMKLVPLPSTREQIEIVAKVDELMALCDQLKSRITQAKQLQQKLADVLVEQAVTQ